jgi:hypothetical protein
MLPTPILTRDSLPPARLESSPLLGMAQRRRIFRRSGLRNRVSTSRVRVGVRRRLDVSGWILWV